MSELTITPPSDATKVLKAGDTMTGNLIIDADHYLNIDGSAVFNETGAAVNFRVESDTNANMLLVDGTNNRVGIGGSPSYSLHVIDSSSSSIMAESNSTTSTGYRMTNTSAGGKQFEFFSTGSGNGSGVGLFGIYNDTDNAGMLTINGSTGSATFRNSAVVGWSSDQYAASNDTGLARNAAGIIEINNGTAGTYRDLQIRSLLQSGKNTNYNNVATAGWGHPAIYGQGRSTAQTAAVASVATYTVGAADGSFVVSANVLVTTATLHNFTVTVTYTDEGNTSRTVTMPFSVLAGTFVTAITNASGAVPYEGLPIHIRCKASTAITIATVGTFTTVTYNVEGCITQIG